MLISYKLINKQNNLMSIDGLASSLYLMKLTITLRQYQHKKIFNKNLHSALLTFINLKHLKNKKQMIDNNILCLILIFIIILKSVMITRLHRTLDN